MKYTGFIGPTYTLQSVKADCQRAVNCYPEFVESSSAPNREVGVLRCIPGLSKKVSVGTGPIRCIYYTSTGVSIVASGDKVYLVNSSFVATEVGTINPGSGTVRMSDNGQQLIIVDGTDGWVLSFITGVFTKITDEDFPACDTVIFQDGYFFVNNSGTGQFAFSSLYDGTAWDSLDYGTAEGLPDTLVSLISYQHQIWLPGSQSTEIYWNSGNVDFPFSRVDGAFIELGCAAPHSVAKAGGALFWLTDKGYIAQANGYAPVRVSNHGVELAFRKAGDLSQAVAYTYSQDGHYFYAIDIPGATSLWVYDMTTSVWHERCDFVDGAFSKIRGIWYTNTPHGIICGDRENGDIYLLDQDTYTLDGDPLIMERTAPHLQEEMKRLFISKMELMLETGVGLDGTAQGTDPQVMLSISRDGGQTWGPELWRSAGKIGEYHHRAIWRQLGYGRDLVYKIRISDPIKRTILGASIDMTAGAY